MDDLYDEWGNPLHLSAGDSTDEHGRFGNFVGEPEESDSDAHGDASASANAYTFSEEPEEQAEVNDQQLMEIDGISTASSHTLSSRTLLGSEVPSSHTLSSRTLLGSEVPSSHTLSPETFRGSEVPSSGTLSDDDVLIDNPDNVTSNAVVLHEDKQYYPTAQQVYGADVETLVQEEDTQSLAQPIVAPVVQKKFTIQEDGLPPVFFKRVFMTDLMRSPEQIRNIAFAGHLHHGKTALMDGLVMETHDIGSKLEKNKGKKAEEQLRYTDVTILERERGLSVKTAPMSL
ncbi:hypothetical protein LTR28_001186, partial [Elasticomyces elasticus]